MHFYKHRFELPAKPGTLIFVQTDEEIEIGQDIIEMVLGRWKPPANFYHLQKGGHVSALHRHKHDNIFARLDIENFFGTITRNKVHRSLKKIGFSFADAHSLAHRSCVQVGGARRLPFGYVQSPVLASLVLDKSALGKEMRKIGRETGVFVSVFMDDIIISHKDSEGAVLKARDALISAAQNSTFKFSEEKQQGPAKEIRAFNIRLSNEQLEIVPERFAEFERHVLQFGSSDSTYGVLGYVGAINPQQCEKLELLIR